MWYTTSGYNISMSFVLYVYTDSSDQHILIWLCDLNEAWPIIPSLDYIFTIQIWLCQNQSLPIQTVHWNDRLHIQLYIINYEYQHILVFLECNCSLISLMAMKWHTKLEIVEKRCPIVFQGHPSNCKVTWDKNQWFLLELSISKLLLQLEFTDGFWNVPQSLM